jgi:hypothetical protein
MAPDLEQPSDPNLIARLLSAGLWIRIRIGFPVFMDPDPEKCTYFLINFCHMVWFGKMWWRGAVARNKNKPAATTRSLL